MSPALRDPPPAASGHRLLWGLSAALLLALSAWCVVLLVGSVDLRQDLEARRAWIDDLRGLRFELERPGRELTERRPRLEGLRRAAQQMATAPEVDDVASPGVGRAASRLASSLEQLARALDGVEAGGTALGGAALGEPVVGDPAAGDLGGAAGERVWDASFAVLKAAGALEDQIDGEIDDIYRRLDGHWRSLNVLMLVCILLCGSNLALLHVVQRRRRQLETAHARALELASHDALTGLWNRDAILKMLRRELARSKRLRVPLGVVLADLDDFQQINGLLGQDQADLVLQEVAWRFGSLVRPYDTLGRFDGDSFLALLPNCDELATRTVGDRLRRAVNEQEVEYGLGRLEVRTSVAVVAVDKADDTDADLLIHRLQDKLVQLRRSGRSGAFAALPDA